MNPPELWVRSDEPAHPAIVSRDEYDAVQARARANERSRSRPAIPSPMSTDFDALVMAPPTW